VGIVYGQWNGVLLGDVRLASVCVWVLFGRYFFLCMDSGFCSSVYLFFANGESTFTPQWRCYILSTYTEIFCACARAIMLQNVSLTDESTAVTLKLTPRRSCNQRLEHPELGER